MATKVYIIYYSMYGHTERLAEEIQKGAASVEGIEAKLWQMEEVKGGSPYGAGTFAGDGSRQPTRIELEQAFHQEKYIATMTKKLKAAA